MPLLGPPYRLPALRQQPCRLWCFGAEAQHTGELHSVTNALSAQAGDGAYSNIGTRAPLSTLWFACSSGGLKTASLKAEILQVSVGAIRNVDHGYFSLGIRVIDTLHSYFKLTALFQPQLQLALGIACSEISSRLRGEETHDS